MTTALAAAEHWERIADEAESQARWDREHGIDLSAPGQSAGDHRAATYRRTARALHLEHETGVPHCLCHHKPSRECPYSGQGIRV